MVAVLAPRDYHLVVVSLQRFGVFARIRGVAYGAVVRAITEWTLAGRAVVAHETPSVLCWNPEPQSGQ